MRWILDNTGRLARRPYYEDLELDRRCEAVVNEFMVSRRREVSFPIETDDLMVLIEQHADLDSMADLSHEGPDVEGVTIFGPQPLVRISERLWEPRRENRLRTTLTHELGHVIFHNPLWVQRRNQMQFDFVASPVESQCRRESMLGIKSVDWMEWQAGYACGAFLMPYSPLQKLVSLVRQGSQEVASVTSVPALIEATRDRFSVSEEAAQVRLAKLGFIVEGQDKSDFFPGA